MLSKDSEVDDNRSRPMACSVRNEKHQGFVQQASNQEQIVLDRMLLETVDSLSPSDENLDLPSLCNENDLQHAICYCHDWPSQCSQHGHGISDEVENLLAVTSSHNSGPCESNLSCPDTMNIQGNSRADCSVIRSVLIVNDNSETRKQETLVPEVHAEAPAAKENNQDPVTSDMYLITECLSRECSVMMERLKICSDLISTCDSLEMVTPNESDEKLGPPSSFLYSVASISELIIPTYLCEIVEVPCVRSANSSMVPKHFDLAIIESPGVISAPITTGENCDLQIDSTVCCATGSVRIAKKVERTGQEKLFTLKENSSSMADVSMIDSCKSSKSDSSCSTEESIRLLRRNSHAMKAKLRGAIEIVRDKASPLLGTKRNVTSHFVNMMAPTRELRVLLRPLQVDKLVAVDSPTDRTFNTVGNSEVCDLTDSGNGCLDNDTASDAGSEDPDYSPNGCETDSVSDDDGEDLRNGKPRNPVMEVSMVPRVKLLPIKPQATSAAEQSCVRQLSSNSNHTIKIPQIVGCRPVLMQNATKLPNHGLSFPQTVVQVLNASGNGNCSARILEDSHSKKDGALRSTQGKLIKLSPNHMNGSESKPHLKVEPSANTVVINNDRNEAEKCSTDAMETDTTPTNMMESFLPAFEACDKAGLPSISQMSLTDISLPTANPSINCTLDQLLPSDPDCLYIGGFSSSKSPSAFHAVKSQCRPVSNEVSRGCVVIVPPVNTCKLVQLDGSPESSSAESEVELDFAANAQRSPSKLMISCRAYDEWMSTRRRTNDPALIRASAKASEADKEVITALLFEEMLSRVVCNNDHKSCKFRQGCVRGAYNYMNEAEKKKLYLKNPVAKGFELHCQPDDETEIVRDLLYDMTNRVICQVEHTAENTGVRKCRPGETCVMFKKIHKSKRPPTPLLKWKSVQQRSNNRREVKRETFASKGKACRSVVSVRKRGNTKSSKSKRTTKRISNRELDSLLGNSLFSTNTMPTRRSRRESTSAREMMEIGSSSQSTDYGCSDASNSSSLFKTQKLNESGKDGGWSDLDDDGNVSPWCENDDDDDDDDIDELLDSLQKVATPDPYAATSNTPRTRQSRNSSIGRQALPMNDAQNQAQIPTSGAYSDHTTPSYYPPNDIDLLSGALDSSAGAHSGHYTGQALQQASFDNSANFNSPSFYQGLPQFTDRPSCAYNSGEQGAMQPAHPSPIQHSQQLQGYPVYHGMQQGNQMESLSASPYALRSRPQDLSLVGNQFQSQTEIHPVIRQRSPAGSRHAGSSRGASPASSNADALAPTMTMDEAFLQSIEGDRELITATLLEEMLNKAVCNTNHKTCQFSRECRRGFHIYLSEEDKQTAYKENPVAKGFELHCQPDDETEIVRDLLYDMTNRVVCDVEHTTEKTGIRKCRPGETCVIFKKFHKSKRPPTPVLETKNIFEKSKARACGRGVKKTGKAKTSVKGKAKQALRPSAEQNTRETRPTRRPKRISNGSWSDLDTDNGKSSSAYDSPADEPVKRSKVIATATAVSITTGRRSKRSAAARIDTEAKTDSQGVAVLPDLSVDVVLPDTSSECLTEPDSAGELTSRRKNLRKKKRRTLTKEERDKQREQMIAQRRTTLKYMGTPRSLVLAQLVQEEAQKQCAEILLPKNLPVYVPDKPAVRSFLFPSELKLKQEDIADIVNGVLPAERAPPGFDCQTIISEMCEVQSSGLVSDSQLLYQLCMFINTSTTDPVSLHALLQVVANYSHDLVKRCPLPACNSQVYDNWTQVGTHLLLHLPAVYLQLMSEAFRCRECWSGFPTPYHHMGHHKREHKERPYSPAILTGFPSSALQSFWSSSEFTHMLFIDWPASMGAAKREAVEDYSTFRTGSAAPVVPPATYRCCDAAPLEPCQYVSDSAEPSIPAPVDAVDVASSEESELPTSSGTVESLYAEDCIAGVHTDAGVGQTLVCTEDGSTQPAASGENDETADAEVSETMLEQAVDTMTSQVLSELREERVGMADPTAYICWYCARPFIGRMSFYIHLLQEALAVPASGLLSGCVFGDEEELTSCHICGEGISVHNVEDHLLSHHTTESQPSHDTDSAERNYCKESKSCPCNGCLQVFADWTALGDHIVCVHTPSSRRAMIKHSCTSCGQIFSSYYHARAHWDTQTSKCFLESRADAVQPFTGHTLPNCYWTENVACLHDITFTKYKKYTFCSTYKSSVHVMCFVCHKLFYRDSDDLEMDSLSQMIAKLQDDLSSHMSTRHQLQLTTGAEPKEADVINTELFSDDSEEAADQPPAKQTVEQTAAEGEEVINVTIKSRDKIRHCLIHGRRKAEYTGQTAIVCKKCVNLRIWAISTSRTCEYSYTLSSYGENSYCLTHPDSLIAIHDSQPYLSYCVDCAETNYGSFRRICRGYCDAHGPWIEQGKCQKCQKLCKPFTEKEVESKCTEDSTDDVEFDEIKAEEVAVDSQSAEVAVDSQSAEVAVDSQSAEVAVDSQSAEVAVDSQSADMAVASADEAPLETFTITDIADAGETLDDTSVAITYVSELPTSDTKRKVYSGRKKKTLKDPPTSQQSVAEGSTKPSTDVQKVDSSKLTVHNCKFHPKGLVFSCPLKGSDDLRTNICKTCRTLHQLCSVKNVVKKLKPTSCVFCTHHPTSPIIKLQKPSYYYCIFCANIKLASDIICQFHPHADLQLARKTKHVQGCRTCIRSHDLVREQGTFNPSRHPDFYNHCLIHPKSPIAVNASTNSSFYCNSCAAKGNEVRYSCKTHGAFDSKSWKVNTGTRLLSCPQCSALLVADLEPLPLVLVKDDETAAGMSECLTSSVTSDDLALCYALFNGNKQAKVNPVTSVSSDFTPCKYVKDSETMAVLPTQASSRKSCKASMQATSVDEEKRAGSNNTTIEELDGKLRFCSICNKCWINEEHYRSHECVTVSDIKLANKYSSGALLDFPADDKRLSANRDTRPHTVDTNLSDILTIKDVSKKSSSLSKPPSMDEKPRKVHTKLTDILTIKDVSEKSSSLSKPPSAGGKSLKVHTKFPEILAVEDEDTEPESLQEDSPLPEVHTEPKFLREGNTLPEVHTDSKSLQEDSPLPEVYTDPKFLQEDSPLPEVHTEAESLQKDSQLSELYTEDEFLQADSPLPEVYTMEDLLVPNEPSIHIDEVSETNKPNVPTDEPSIPIDNKSVQTTNEAVASSEHKYFCSKCNFAHRYKRQYDRHVYLHTCKNVHKCGKCSFLSATKTSMEEHYKSSLCGTFEKNCSSLKTEGKSDNVGASRDPALQTKTENQPPSTGYQCKRCRYIAVDEAAREEHKRAHNSNSCMRCHQCHYLADTAASLRKHLSSCKVVGNQPKPLFSVPSIATGTTNPPVRTRRWTEGHIYCCPLCTCVMTSHAAVTSHEHPTGPLYPCAECFYVADSPNLWRTHRLAHKNPAALQCSACHYRHSSQAFMNKHRKMCKAKHFGNGLGKSTAVDGLVDGQALEGQGGNERSRRNRQRPLAFRKKNLTRLKSVLKNKWHRKSAATAAGTDAGAHSTAVWNRHKFMCQHCDVQATSFNEYSTHMQKCHPGKSVWPLMPCSKCPYVAKDLDTLNVHMRLHAKRTLHRCPHCYYINNQTRHFEKHLLMCKAAKGSTELAPKPVMDNAPAPKPVKLKNKREKKVAVPAILGKHLQCAPTWNDHRFKCVKCGYDITGLEDFRSHMDSQHDDRSRSRVFLCCYCPFVTSGLSAFNNHIARHKDPSAIECSNAECPMLCWNKEGLAHHLTKCMFAGNNVEAVSDWTRHQLLCDHCDHSFKSHEDYKNHMKAEHPDAKPVKLFLCKQCPYVSSSHNLSKHVLCHSLPTAVKCPCCPFLCTTMKFLQSHWSKCRYKSEYKGELPPEMIEAPAIEAVPKSTLTAKAWNNHQYRCEISKCTYDVTGIDDYTRHMADVHPYEPKSRIWLCEKCPFVTTDHNRFYVHLHLHDSPDAVKCPCCTFLGMTTKALRTHLFRQCRYVDGASDLSSPATEGSMPAELEGSLAAGADGLWGNHVFYCPLCAEECKSEISYWLHAKNKHAGCSVGSLHLCTKCPYVACRKYDIDMHMTLHKKPTAVVCERCSFLSSSQDKLEMHMTRCKGGTAHTGNVNYSSVEAVSDWARHQLLCDRCDHSFKSHEDYKNHMKAEHPDIRRVKLFLCEQCPYVSGSYNFHKHVLCHSLPTAVKCPCCPFLGKTMKFLQSHWSKCRYKSEYKGELRPEMIEAPAIEAETMTVPTKKRDTWRDHKFACSHCPHLITEKQDYWVHMNREHVNEKLSELFPCTRCPYIAQNVADHKIHSYRHAHPTFKQTCSFCFYIGKSKDNLDIHQKKCNLARLNASQGSTGVETETAGEANGAAASVPMETEVEDALTANDVMAVCTAEYVSPTARVEDEPCEDSTNQNLLVTKKAAKDIATKLKKKTLKLKKLYESGQLDFKSKDTSAATSATSVVSSEAMSSMGGSTSDSREHCVDPQPLPMASVCRECMCMPVTAGSTCTTCASHVSLSSDHSMQVQPSQPGEGYDSLQELEEVLDIDNMAVKANPDVEIVDVSVDDIETAASQVSQVLLEGTDKGKDETRVHSGVLEASSTAGDVSASTSSTAAVLHGSGQLDFLATRPVTVEELDAASQSELEEEEKICSTAAGGVTDCVTGHGTSSVTPTYKEQVLTGSEDVPSTDTAIDYSIKAIPDDGTKVILDDGTKAILDDGTKAIPDVGTKAIQDDSTKAILDDGTKAIPDDSTKAIPDDGTKAIQDDSTKAILDDGTKAIPDDVTKAVQDDGTKAIPDDGTKAVQNDGGKTAADDAITSAASQRDDDDIELVVKKTVVCYSKRRRTLPKPSTLEAGNNKDSMNFPQLLPIPAITEAGNRKETNLPQMPPKPPSLEADNSKDSINLPQILPKPPSLEADNSKDSINLPQTLPKPPSLEAGNSKDSMSLPQMLPVPATTEAGNKKSIKNLPRALPSPPTAQDGDKTVSNKAGTKAKAPKSVQHKKRVAKNCLKDTAAPSKTEDSTAMVDTVPTPKARATRSMTALKKIPKSKETADRKRESYDPAEVARTPTVDEMTVATDEAGSGRRKSTRKRAPVIRHDASDKKENPKQKRRVEKEQKAFVESSTEDKSEAMPARTSKRLRSSSSPHRMTGNGAGQVAAAAKSLMDAPVVADKTEPAGPPAVVADTESIDPPLVAAHTGSVDTPVVVDHMELVDASLVTDHTGTVDPPLAAKNRGLVDSPLAADNIALSQGHPPTSDNTALPQGHPPATDITALSQGNSPTSDNTALHQSHSPTAEDLILTPPTPEKAKRRIKLDEYLKRGPRSSDEHGWRNSSSAERELDLSGRCSGSTKLSPNTHPTAGRKCIEPISRQAIDFKQAPASAVTSASRHAAHDSNAGSNDYEEVRLTCGSCKAVLHGLRDVIFHTEFHSSTRCYCCHRRFDDLHYLHSHITTVHLGMQHADFERWTYINSKKNEILLLNEGKGGAAAATLVNSDPAVDDLSNSKSNSVKKTAEVSQRKRSSVRKPRVKKTAAESDATLVMPSLHYPQVLHSDPLITNRAHVLTPSGARLQQPTLYLHVPSTTQCAVDDSRQQSLLPLAKEVTQLKASAQDSHVQQSHAPFTEEPIVYRSAFSAATKCQDDSVGSEIRPSVVSVMDELHATTAEKSKNSPDALVPPMQQITDQLGYKTTHLSPAVHPVVQKTTEVLPTAHQVGYQTTQVPPAAHSIGHQITQVPPAAHSIGHQITQVPPAAHSIGHQTTQVPPTAHSIGHQTIQVPPAAHSRGHQTTQVLPVAYPIGHLTTQVPPHAHKIGHHTTQVSPTAHPLVHQITQAPQTDLQPLQVDSNRPLSLDERLNLVITEPAVTTPYYLSQKNIPSYRTSKPTDHRQQSFVSTSPRGSTGHPSSRSGGSGWNQSQLYEKRHNHGASPCRDMDLRRPRGADKDWHADGDRRNSSNKDIDLRVSRTERGTRAERHYIPDSPSRDLDLRQRKSVNCGGGRERYASHGRPVHGNSEKHHHSRSRSRDQEVKERRGSRRNPEAECRSQSREDQTGYCREAEPSRKNETDWSHAYRSDYANVHSYNRSSSERRSSADVLHGQRSYGGHHNPSQHPLAEERMTRAGHSSRGDNLLQDRRYESRDHSQVEKMSDRRKSSAREDRNESHHVSQRNESSKPSTSSSRPARTNHSSKETKGRISKGDKSDCQDSKEISGRQDMTKSNIPQNDSKHDSEHRRRSDDDSHRRHKADTLRSNKREHSASKSDDPKQAKRQHCDDGKKEVFMTTFDGHLVRLKSGESGELEFA